MKFTAIIEMGESGWYVGQINELPAAISHGRNLEDIKANLIDAVSYNRNEEKDLYL